MKQENKIKVLLYRLDRFEHNYNEFEFDKKVGEIVEEALKIKEGSFGVLTNAMVLMLPEIVGNPKITKRFAEDMDYLYQAYYCPEHFADLKDSRPINVEKLFGWEKK